MCKRLIAAVVVLAAALLAAACGSPPSHHHYRTLPKPPLPHNQAAPPSSCEHAMGDCLPRPKATASGLSGETGAVFVELASASSTTGPDFSNNRPVPSAAFAQIAARNGFVYLKSVEGTGFTDQTAAAMAAAAKARGLPVGGYDFLHVCTVGAAAEAAHFVAAARAQGVLGGLRTLAPAGDAEWPLGSLSCSGRVWLQTWVDAVYADDGGVCPILYTGAWWWQPHIGAWWPTCRNVKLLSWVSGYNVPFPFMPAGESTLNLWQFADNGFNGYNTADLSRWFSGNYAAFVGAPKPGPTRSQIASWTRARNASLAAYRAQNCTMPVLGTKACGTLARRVVYFAGRLPGKHVRCWGTTRNVARPVCVIVRPEVSIWSRARAAAERTLRTRGCRRPYRRVVCKQQGGRVASWTRQINSTMKAW